MTDCVRCLRPVADTGYACHGCATGLSVALLRAGLLMRELDTTIARLDQLGDGGASSAETPLFFDWDASDAAWAIRNTLTSWTRHICETRGITATSTTNSGLAAWLAKQTGWLRMRPEAEEAFDELHNTTRHLRRTIDTHVERWYAGRCGVPLLDDDGDCTADLYALPGAAWVTCPECGASFDAEDRKAELLDEVRDTLQNAETIARALSIWGWPTTSAQIRGYAFRGRIVPHGQDGKRPLYRIGDVIEVLMTAARQRQPA